VFRSLRQAKQLPWEYMHPEDTPLKIRQTRKKNLRKVGVKIRLEENSTWRDHPTLRVVAFSLGIIACLSLLVFWLPSAKVYLSPDSQTQQLNLWITANPTIYTYNLSDFYYVLPVPGFI